MKDINQELPKPNLFSFILDIQAICLRTIENYCNKFKIQLFTYLLALFIVRQLRFYFGCTYLAGLTVGLAINEAVTVVVKVALGLSG